MRLWILVLLCCLFILPASAQEAALVPTSEWEPPVITKACRETEPWLLVLKIAQEELGYVEGPRSNQTKYGEWFNGGRPAWCAEFLTWCVNEADMRYGTNLMNNVFPWYGLKKEGAPWFIQRGRFISITGSIPNTREKQWLIGSETYLKSRGYIPSPGDYIWFFYHTFQKGSDHVAIVEGISRDENGTVQIHVIEGNNPDRVQRATYALTDKHIYGFGTPVRRAYTNVALYDTFDDVQLLDQILIAQGYLEPRSTPRRQVDKELLAALKSYQRANGLDDTGVWDIATRRFMEQHGHIPAE